MRRRFALRPADSKVTRSNLAQAGVTIAVAVALTVATLLSSQAGDAWEQSVRDEIKHGAALAADVRLVYGDEAPPAFELALSEARMAELPAGGADVERETQFHIRRALRAGGNGLVEERHERAGGYDVIGRLAEVRDDHASLTTLDPDDNLGQADRLRDWSLAVSFLAVPLVVWFLVVDSRRRRTSVPAASTGDDADLDLVPRPWSSAEPRRFTTWVMLGAWVLVTLLPVLQLYYDGREHRAQTLAARHAAELGSLLQASGVASSFVQASGHRVAWLGTHATAHQYVGEVAAAGPDGSAAAARRRADARVEEVVAARAERIWREMARAPARPDAIDARTAEAIATTPEALGPRQREQAAQAARAEEAGTLASRVTLALLLAALALSLAALASVAPARRPSLLDLSAAAVLGVAVVALASVALV